MVVVVWTGSTRASGMPLQQRSTASWAAFGRAEPAGWGRWCFPLLRSGETYLGCWVQLWTPQRETETPDLWKCLRRGDWSTGRVRRGWRSWVSSAGRREGSERPYCCLQGPRSKQGVKRPETDSSLYTVEIQEATDTSRSMGNSNSICRGKKITVRVAKSWCRLLRKAVEVLRAWLDTALSICANWTCFGQGWIRRPLEVPSNLNDSKALKSGYSNPF